MVSLAICLVTFGSFVGFAVEQSKAGSNTQQAEVDAASPATASTGSLLRTKAASSNKSAFREAVDKVFAKLASPFTGLTDKISSQWTLHIVNALLALLIYGFGLGFLARALRFGE